MENNISKNDTSIFKIIGGIFTAAFMWGSGNVLSRSLLIEGVGEIFLITTRVSIIGTLLLIHYSIFNKDKFNKPWCKVGDWVMFARYAGARLPIEGGEVRILNDDEVLGTIGDPESVLHYI